MQQHLTISEIVRKDYRTADVFKKHGINYCCGGNISLDEVCKLQQLDNKVIEHDLSKATQIIRLSNRLNYSEWPLEFLIEYIINVHHSYIKNTIPELSDLMRSFVNGHKNKYSYLPLVQETFENINTHLTNQITREEEIIFPYFKQINNTHKRKEVYGSLFVKTLNKSLDKVVQEQLTTTIHLQNLRQATNNYSYTENVCTRHQVIYHKLKELDADLVQHSFLENEFLIPRVTQLEKELLTL
jgi:regulator of cell morphogenesis and NO signaling